MSSNEGNHSSHAPVANLSDPDEIASVILGSADPMALVNNISAALDIVLTSAETALQEIEGTNDNNRTTSETKPTTPREPQEAVSPTRSRISKSAPSPRHEIPPLQPNARHPLFPDIQRAFYVHNSCSNSHSIPPYYHTGTPPQNMNPPTIRGMDPLKCCHEPHRHMIHPLLEGIRDMHRETIICLFPTTSTSPEDGITKDYIFIRPKDTDVRLGRDDLDKSNLVVDYTIRDATERLRQNTADKYPHLYRTDLDAAKGNPAGIPTPLVGTAHLWIRHTKYNATLVGHIGNKRFSMETLPCEKWALLEFFGLGSGYPHGGPRGGGPGGGLGRPEVEIVEAKKK